MASALIRPVAAGLSRAVLHDIGGRILRGELEVGEPIGNEAALVSAYGVSRTTIREAIRTLAGKGLIEARPRVGTRVLPRDRWSMLDPDVLAWMFTGTLSIVAMRHLHEIRCIIEPAAAALAAERATDEALERIALCCERMEAARNVDSFSTADLEFHTAILEAAANPFVSTFASGIRTSLLAFFRATDRDPNAFRIGRPLHRRLAEALEARDPEAARTASLKVLAGAGRVIAKLEAGSGRGVR
jgi:GntR family transcriptional regulator, galactonate operon transcriptional repressor